MQPTSAFLERVLKKIPTTSVTSYRFDRWEISGQPTQEGFGLLPIANVDPDKLIERVMDVDHYLGNIEHVEACRMVPDSRYTPPQQVRFYQRIGIPVLGSVHHELVLTDAGEIQGFRVAFWTMLETETAALNPKQGARSQYNDGAWFAKPGLVGYALRSAPRRDDVGFLKWQALTRGADVAANTVIRTNIEAMSRWSQRS